MRPTLLRFRAPDERTAELIQPEINKDGHILDITKGKKQNPKGSNLPQSLRFPASSFYDKSTGQSVFLGPASYNPQQSFNIVQKMPCQTVMRQSAVIDSNASGEQHFIMVGDQVKYEPAWVSNKQHKDMNSTAEIPKDVTRCLNGMSHKSMRRATVNIKRRKYTSLTASNSQAQHVVASSVVKDEKALTQEFNKTGKTQPCTEDQYQQMNMTQQNFASQQQLIDSSKAPIVESKQSRDSKIQALFEQTHSSLPIRSHSPEPAKLKRPFSTSGVNKSQNPNAFQAPFVRLDSCQFASRKMWSGHPKNNANSQNNRINCQNKSGSKKEGASSTLFGASMNHSNPKTTFHIIAKQRGLCSSSTSYGRGSQVFSNTQASNNGDQILFGNTTKIYSDKRTSSNGQFQHQKTASQTDFTQIVSGSGSMAKPQRVEFFGNDALINKQQSQPQQQQEFIVDDKTNESQEAQQISPQHIQQTASGKNFWPRAQTEQSYPMKLKHQQQTVGLFKQSTAPTNQNKRDIFYFNEPQTENHMNVVRETPLCKQMKQKMVAERTKILQMDIDLESREGKRLKRYLDSCKMQRSNNAAAAAGGNSSGQFKESLNHLQLKNRYQNDLYQEAAVTGFQDAQANNAADFYNGEIRDSEVVYEQS